MNGVIYLSFGTNIDPRLLSPDRIQVIANTFSKLPYDVLWKWNGDALPGKPKNVKIAKWFPQNDLLSNISFKFIYVQFNRYKQR